MHTETNTMLNNNMQHQQLYMSHLSQDHLIPETHNQHLFNTLPSTIDTASTSLSEGLYAPATPQQHLTSECLSQYYNNATSRHGCPTTSSSSSPSSSSASSSSNDSHYSRPNSSAQQHCKNNDNNLNRNAGILGVNLRVTGQCSQGGRKYMEDYFSVAYQQSENVTDLEYAFIGIYDGHGGAEAAKFAKEHLMMEIINQRLFWSDNDHDVLRAIREGYIATHYAMWRQQEKWPKTANGLPSTAGTTATVAFIRREKIYIGHVGDSGIVLGYQNENENFWRAKQLTTDHKPESVEERTRIINSGGKVVIKSGVPRVVWNRPRNSSHRGPIRKKTLIDEIPFLAVARSLGDLWSYNSERNEFVVSPDPDVKVIPINPKTFRCLIFGTDGLWNVVTAQEAVNTVHEKEVINERLLVQRGDSPYEGNQWTNPSKSLVDQALRTWSNKKMRADNTSVVTVILYPPGQGETGKELVCNEAANTPNNPPAFLQPMSYGLEYTQVQAEVPAYDNVTTYKEMALKYLPPEAYRDFNYYADGSDTEGEENEESEDDEEEEEEEEQEVLFNPAATGGDLQPNTNYQQNLPNPNDWNWQANNTNIPTQITYEEDRQVVEGDEEEDEEEEDEEEEEEEEENITAEGTDSQNNERQVCILNYQNYVHMDAEETNNATDSYINTFAESYNSILTASQDDCVSAATSSSSSSSSSSSKSNSNSNSNFQSVTPPNMRAILQEQQLYQQQCMSEEEGYSLTKLETRREQQTCKLEERTTHLTNETTAAVQTFKIFHETSQPQQIELYDTNTERFYAQQHQFMQQVQPKPLELHSLLQQEREEEQQVAYERMQQQQQHHQNIAAYACLQAVNSIPNPVLEEQPSVEVEYLEEESSLMEDEIIVEDSTALQQDETVQINEISSSSCGVGLILEESNSELELSQEHEFIEKIEIIPNVIHETNAEAEAEVEESQVLKKSSKLEPLKVSQNSICIPPPTSTAPAPSSLTITPLKSNQKHSKRAKFSYLYNNVPNENLQRISSKHSLYHGASNSTGNRRGSVCMTPSVNITPPTVTSTPMIQRQLRSTSTICANSPNTTPIIEYGKRTLRARNSLAKDMKAKANLVQAALKYPHNAVTRNFLRTTAANLMVGKPLLINDLNVTPCSRRSLAANNNIRPSNRSSIKTRREKSGVTINGSLNQSKAHIQNSPDPQLNLRSRQPVSTPSSVTTPPSTNISSLRSLPATSTPVMKRASLTEHRILRSTHTHSTSSKSSQTPANFSKSTRTQSTGSNLAAPPPSPKLINAAAAVAAATRARSLLNAKHAAAANGTQSAVSAVFGKRSSLRSNGSTHPAVMSSSNSANLPSPASTHQTLRGRIVKKMKR